MIVQHSRSPTIFLRVTWESSQVYADPLRARPKLSKPVVGGHHLVNLLDKFIGCDEVLVLLSPELRKLGLLDLDSHTSICALNHLGLHNGDIMRRLDDRSDQQLLLLLLLLRLLVFLASGGGGGI
jgi:hypothetical protein